MKFFIFDCGYQGWIVRATSLEEAKAVLEKEYSRGQKRLWEVVKTAECKVVEANGDPAIVFDWC